MLHDQGGGKTSAWPLTITRTCHLIEISLQLIPIVFRNTKVEKLSGYLTRDLSIHSPLSTHSDASQRPFPKKQKDKKKTTENVPLEPRR